MTNPQTKTQKKIDNKVRLALTDACEQFLEDIAGFQWLTHEANYSNFVASLLITCVFDTKKAETPMNGTKLRVFIASSISSLTLV